MSARWEEDGFASQEAAALWQKLQDMNKCYGCFPLSPEPRASRTGCSRCGGWLAPEVVDTTSGSEVEYVNDIVYALLYGDLEHAKLIAEVHFRKTADEQRARVLEEVPSKGTRS